VKENNECDACVRGERNEIGAGVRESGEKKRTTTRARVSKVLWSARALDDADVPDAWTTRDGDDDGEWVEPDAAGER